MTRRLLPLALCAFAAGCGGSTLVLSSPVVPPKAPLRLTAVVAGGGESDFPSLLEAELSSRGYGILDHQKTAGLLQSLGVDSGGVTSPQARAELKSRRIDSIMKIDVANVPSEPTLLDKVMISVTSVDDALVLTSFLWTNAWAGEPRSMADSDMRLTPVQAARQIAVALVQQLGAPGDKILPRLDAPAQSPTASAATAAAPAGKPWWEK